MSAGGAKGLDPVAFGRDRGSEAVGPLGDVDIGLFKPFAEVAGRVRPGFAFKTSERFAGGGLGVGLDFVLVPPGDVAALAAAMGAAGPGIPPTATGAAIPAVDAAHSRVTAGVAVAGAAPRKTAGPESAGSARRAACGQTSESGEEDAKVGHECNFPMTITPRAGS